MNNKFNREKVGIIRIKNYLKKVSGKNMKIITNKKKIYKVSRNHVGTISIIKILK